MSFSSKAFNLLGWTSYKTEILLAHRKHIDQNVRHNGSEGVYPSTVIENKMEEYNYHSQDTVFSKSNPQSCALGIPLTHISRMNNPFSFAQK